MSLTSSALAIDPALLQRLKGLELKSRFLVRGLYSNRHRTSQHGASTEFVEHRQYRRGDEIRSIDWRVLARTDRLYVKVHEMEADMRLQLVLDTSQSMRVPPPPDLPSKLELGAIIAGAVGMMAEVQQDAVGLVCLGNKIEEHIPARQGKNHLHTLFEHLSRPVGDGGGKFGELVLSAGERLSSRGMIVLLSDALDDPEKLFEAMKVLRVRQHDVTLIHLLDRNEVDFPFDRMTEFRHPESGRRIVGDPAALRANYLKRFQAHVDLVANYCQRAQADYVRIVNDDDLIKLLSLHFIRRLAGGGRA
jgi:uncharacterized protein (DUF58 family)